MVARKQLWTEANLRLFSIIEKSVGISSKHIIASANTADESNGKAAYVMLRKFAYGGNIHDWAVAARYSCTSWKQDRGCKNSGRAPKEPAEAIRNLYRCRDEAKLASVHINEQEMIEILRSGIAERLKPALEFVIEKEMAGKIYTSKKNWRPDSLTGMVQIKTKLKKQREIY